MDTKTIPAVVMDAASNMLAPFGVNIRELLNSGSSLKEPQLTKKYLTIAEAEKFYSVGRWMIYRAARSGHLRTVKPGGNARQSRVLIDKASLEAWINNGFTPEA